MYKYAKCICVIIAYASYNDTKTFILVSLPLMLVTVAQNIKYKKCIASICIYKCLTCFYLCYFIGKEIIFLLWNATTSQIRTENKKNVGLETKVNREPKVWIFAVGVNFWLVIWITSDESRHKNKNAHTFLMLFTSLTFGSLLRTENIFGPL